MRGAVMILSELSIQFPYLQSMHLVHWKIFQLVVMCILFRCPRKTFPTALEISRLVFLPMRSIEFLGGWSLSLERAHLSKQLATLVPVSSASRRIACKTSAQGDLDDIRYALLILGCIKAGYKVRNCFSMDQKAYIFLTNTFSRLYWSLRATA